MPIIEAKGLEAERGVIIELLKQIPEWAASVKGLEIKPGHVEATFVPIIQVDPGKLAYFCVMELFEVSISGKPRTTTIRKSLCRAIEKGFNKFLQKERVDVIPQKVAVIIYRADVKEGEYYFWVPKSDRT